MTESFRPGTAGGGVKAGTTGSIDSRSRQEQRLADFL